MTKKANLVTDELFDGYQALAKVIVQPATPVRGYHVGYLDGWADAMHHAGWVADGEPLEGKDRFPLLHGKRVRRAVRAAMDAWKGAHRG